MNATLAGLARLLLQTLLPRSLPCVLKQAVAVSSWRSVYACGVHEHYLRGDDRGVQSPVTCLVFLNYYAHAVVPAPYIMTYIAGDDPTAQTLRKPAPHLSRPPPRYAGCCDQLDACL